MLKLFATTAAVALLALSAPALSQTATPGKSPSATPAAPAAPAGRSDTKQDRADKLARQDEKFVKEAAEGGMAEVQLGKLAQQKAQSPEVKKLAETIVKDHEAANAQLTAIGSGKGVDMPKATAEMKGDHKKLHDKLSKANGQEFDREYVKAMVDGHREVKSMLEARAGEPGGEARSNNIGSRATGTSGRSNSPLDTAVNQWATKALPVVEQHLDRAEQIQGSLQRN